MALYAAGGVGFALRGRLKAKQLDFGALRRCFLYINIGSAPLALINSGSLCLPRAYRTIFALLGKIVHKKVCLC